MDRQAAGTSAAAATRALREAAGLKTVVIGGGVFGLAAAVHLARLGAAVTVVSDGPLGGGASGRSLSWLNSARRRSPAYHALRMAGLERYRTLSRQVPGSAAWLRFDGGLTFDADGPDNAIEAVARHEWDIGYEARFLTPDEVAAEVPGVDAAAVTGPGAIFNPGEGWVDLGALIAHLAAELRARGGVVLDEMGPAEPVVTGGRATGVVLADGRRVAADRVLVAAGAAVPRMLAALGVEVADATPLACLVRTAPLDHPLKAVLNTPRVAIRPDVGGRFVLDADWTEGSISPDKAGSYRIAPDTVAALLAEASRVLSGRPVLEARSCGIGPKPIPGDGQPVFGPVDGVAGLSVAFSHSGATLGLIAGELLAREMVTGRPEPLLEPFRVARFLARRPSLLAGSGAAGALAEM